MTDIATLVERLRQRGIGIKAPTLLELEAANALEALQADLVIIKQAFLEERAKRGKDADEIERLREALEGIVQWGKAYPLAVFHEPDFKKARSLLEKGGMTLDAISASNMRHVIEGVAKIASAALAGDKP